MTEPNADSEELDRNMKRFPRFALLHLRRDVDSITRAWLDELRTRLPEHPSRIFPDKTLLNHIPELLRCLIDATLDDSDPTKSAFVEEELLRIGNLRRSQGYGLEEVLSEFEILRRILLDHLRDAADTFDRPIPPADALQVAADFEKTFGRMVEVTSRLFGERAFQSRVERAELLSAFGRAVNHELRNRLNAAVLTLRVLRETDSGKGSEADRGSLMKSLEASLQRIVRVVPDVFSVAVAQGHHAQVEGSVQPLDELVTEVLADLHELALDRHIDISIDGSMPPIQVDGTRVQLVLMNLCTNAIKYSDPKKDPPWIKLRATKTKKPREWRIDVQDNGIGIPEYLQGHIFDEMLRGPGSEDEDGEGLGLSLARRATEQMNGRIWFESQAGHGSTFSFTLEEPSEDLEV